MLTRRARAQGTIEKGDKEGYKCTGIIERIDDTTVEITELPIRTWTQNYKEMLEGWVAGSDKQPAWVKVRSFPCAVKLRAELTTKRTRRTTRSTTRTRRCTLS